MDKVVRQELKIAEPALSTNSANPRPSLPRRCSIWLPDRAQFFCFQAQTSSLMQRSAF